MVDYQKDVEEDAVALILDNEDMFKQAIKDDVDFDRNDIDDLDQVFHESITDRGYTPEDAIFILENCENEETDSGIWDGCEDYREELSARAAYSYANDVWFKGEELYNELKTFYADAYEAMQEQHKEDPEPKDDDEEEDQEDKIKEEAATEAITEFRNRYDPKLAPVEEGSEEEYELLKEWLSLNSKSGMWGGYPLGGSYIDSRCGTGHGMPDVKDYVDFDRLVAKRVPHLRSKYQGDIKSYFEKLERKLKKGKLKVEVADLGDLQNLVLSILEDAAPDSNLHAILGPDKKNKTLKLTSGTKKFVMTLKEA